MHVHIKLKKGAIHILNKSECIIYILTKYKTKCTYIHTMI